MNSRKGFIQIPILIAIIISAIVFGGGSYLIARKMSKPPSLQKIVSEPNVTTTTTEQATSTRKAVMPRMDINAVPAPIPTASDKNKNYNFSESEISLYNGTPKMFEMMAEKIRNDESIPYFKERRDRLVYRLSYAKQWKPLSNYGDGAILNEMSSLYVQEFEKDIRDVDDVFSAIESNIALMNHYRAIYEEKLSQLLADPKKFVTKEEFVKFTESEDVKKLVDREYEGLENVNVAMRKYLDSVDKKEDDYAETKTTIINALSTSIERMRMSASNNYSQPINTYSDSELRQIQADAIKTLKQTTCVFAPGPSGGFAYSTVTCN